MLKHVEIPTPNTGYLMRGYLHDAGREALVVMFHGYTGNKSEHSYHFRNLARRLTKQNISSLRLDYSCNGESDGEFYEFTFTQALTDAQAMLEYAKHLGYQTLFILGYSMGGAIASLVADDDVDGLVLWTPAGNLYQSLQRGYQGKQLNKRGYYEIPGFEISPKMITSMADIDFYRNTSYEKPVLICYGAEDVVVDREAIFRYHMKYPDNELVLFDHSGHGFDYPGDNERLYQITCDFLRFCLQSLIKIDIIK